MTGYRDHESIPGTSYRGFARPRGGDSAARATLRPSRAQSGPLLGLVLAAVFLAGLAGAWTFGGARREQTAPPMPVPAAQSLPQTAPPGALEPPALGAAASQAPAVLPMPAIAPHESARMAPAPGAETRAVVSDRAAFHCEWRLRPSERMVCQDAELRALDRRLNQAFGEAVRAGVPRQSLRRAQDGWVFQREVVARRSRAALVSYYQTRIAELSELARSGAGSP